VTHSSSSGSPFGARASERQQLLTLFDLAHQVTSVLDQDELFEKIRELLGRLIPYDAFAVYLLHQTRPELRIAYPFGYPEGIAENFRLQVGDGIVGTAVAEQRPLLIPDLSVEPRYKGLVPGMRTALVVPLVYKTRVIGALNILSKHENAYDETDLPLLKQFAAAVGVALENGRLFEAERRTSETFETLAEIGKELASILDLDELLTRVGQLVKRVLRRAAARRREPAVREGQRRLRRGVHAADVRPDRRPGRLRREAR
jgi:phosphoserine phosphatase RsbU/P